MGAYDFLSNLPSKGLFSSPLLSSNLGGVPVYVTDHDTSPPEDQLIKTDQTNILIRSLLLKQQQKTDSSTKSAGSSRKRSRSSEKAVDSQTSTKRPASQQGGARSVVPEDLNTLTVERLRVLLRERSLTQRGRKDELIARLRSAVG